MLNLQTASFLILPTFGHVQASGSRKGPEEITGLQDLTASELGYL